MVYMRKFTMNNWIMQILHVIFAALLDFFVGISENNCNFAENSVIILNLSTMALPIASIPVLTGEVAARFEAEA